MKKKQILGLTACAAIVTGLIYFGGNVSAQKSDASTKSGQVSLLDSSPQTLPFSQNWTTTTLITTDDNWSGVPGIIGYRGDDLSTTIDVDLRTVLANGSGTPVDVNANRSDPDAFNTGGLVEFDGIPNPVVAFQGSGTSDIPHMVIHLNTTGQSNIQLSYNARDIDNGTGIDAVQQVNTQFRVGGTGDYTNVTGGYIADASAPGGATLVTPVSVTLPAAANNQALVEIRIMTTNALGTDEFIGIDDISVTGTGGPTTTQNHVDFDGNGRTDFAVVRNTGGGPTGQVTWFIKLNNVATEYGSAWGIASDFFVPEDYDGDNKTDIAIYRPGAATVAAFYILNSSNGTARIELFGQTGDEPRVVGDYDGDGKADPAVYRSGLVANDQSTWFYRGSLTPSFVTYAPWGLNGDFPAPGDYDGDGKRDFVVQRNNGGGQARFWMAQTTAGQSSVVFGTPTDVIVPGDYDGDGKTDLAVTRASAGQINWYVRPSTTGAISAAPTAVFGTSATDFQAHGDYDGDGKTDIAIWRPSATAGASAFWVQGSGGSTFALPWGANGDYPVANYNRF